MATISAPRANYEHYQTSLGNWKNTPIAVGGWEYGDKHVESLENETWIIKTDFPFVASYIRYYSMAALKNNLFLFGKTLIL
mgnify:CR=1 FL=1